VTILACDGSLTIRNAQSGKLVAAESQFSNSELPRENQMSVFQTIVPNFAKEETSNTAILPKVWTVSILKADNALHLALSIVRPSDTAMPTRLSSKHVTQIDRIAVALDAEVRCFGRPPEYLGNSTVACMNIEELVIVRVDRTCSGSQGGCSAAVQTLRLPKLRLDAHDHAIVVKSTDAPTLIIRNGGHRWNVYEVFSSGVNGTAIGAKECAHCTRLLEQSESLIPCNTGEDLRPSQLLISTEGAQSGQKRLRFLSGSKAGLISIHSDNIWFDATDSIMRCFSSASEDRVLLVTSSGRVLAHTLGTETARLVWERDESLASVVQNEIFSAPSRASSKAEKSFARTTLDRTSNFIGGLLDAIMFGDVSSPGGSMRALDEYWRGIVVLVAANGVLSAQSTSTSGETLWRLDLSAILKSHQVKQDASACASWRHSLTRLNESHGVLVSSTDSSCESSMSYVHVLFAHTGELLDSQLLTPSVALGARVSDAREGTKAASLLLLDLSLNLHTAPAREVEIEHAILDGLHWLNASAGASEISGFQCDSMTSCASNPWRWNLPPRERLVNVVAAPSEYPLMSSPVRVAGTGAILFRYQNPNAVVALAMRERAQNLEFGSCDSMHDVGGTVCSRNDEFDPSGLSAYIFDASTGQILESVFHARAAEPVLAVRHENWIVYSYWNSELQEQAVIVADMYEQRAGSWLGRALKSALKNVIQAQPIPRHHKILRSSDSGDVVVVRQSFLLDERITSMGVTQTEHSITSRAILLALATERVLQIPKIYLDPRRPVAGMYTEAHRAELLIPFNPLIPTGALAFPGGYATRDRVVSWLGLHGTGIKTQPIHRHESSCHALFVGLDIMYTILSPAGRFDSPADDFNYSMVLFTGLGVLLLSWLAQKYAAKQLLKWSWT